MLRLSLAVIFFVVLHQVQAGDKVGIYCTAAKCPYKPVNTWQLQFCGSAGKLGGQGTDILFKCQNITDPIACQKKPTNEKTADCIWIKTPEGLTDSQGVGSCLPHSVGSPVGETLMGLQIVVGKLKEEGYEVPSTKEMNNCFQHSYKESDCLKAFDGHITQEEPNGRPCGWCSGLNPRYFPYYPEMSNFCMPKHVIDKGACKDLKKDMKPCVVVDDDDDDDDGDDEDKDPKTRPTPSPSPRPTPPPTVYTAPSSSAAGLTLSGFAVFHLCLL